MNLSKLAPIAVCALLAACSPSDPDTQAPAPAAGATTSAPVDAAAQTEASYGDEAPVAIEADRPKVEDDHAHAADGSHAEGDEHGDEAGGDQPAKADDAHAHEAGEADHDH